MMSWLSRINICMIILLLYFTQTKCEAQCEHGDTRLVQNISKFEGGVEVCLNGNWGTVCNDFWGPNEVRVVCRQLGFYVTGTEQFIDLMFLTQRTTVIDNINCTGLEQNLTACDFDRNADDCQENFHRVGVRCHEERPPQNVTVVLSANELSILWEEPARGLTKSVIQHYSIECFSQNSVNDSNYTYSIRAIRDNGTYHIQLPVDVNTYVNYNCCVEVNFETYSSVACDSASLTMDNRTVTVSLDLQNVIEQSQNLDRVLPIIILGVVTAILIVLLSISLAVIGCLLISKHKSGVSIRKREMYVTKHPDRIKKQSDSDESERVVENPTYGDYEDCHQSQTNTSYYSNTGPSCTMTAVK